MVGFLAEGRLGRLWSARDWRCRPWRVALPKVGVCADRFAAPGDP